MVIVAEILLATLSRLIEITANYRNIIIVMSAILFFSSLRVWTDHSQIPHGQRDRERKGHRFLDRLPTARHGLQQEQDQTAVISEFLSGVCSWINGIIPLSPPHNDGQKNIIYDILWVLIICIYQYISLCKSMLFIIIRFVRRICLTTGVSKTIVSNYPNVIIRFRPHSRG